MPIEPSSWVAGGTALAFVLAFGASVIADAVRAERARRSIALRLLVTGTRGKSGTARLIHAALSGGDDLVYAKMTGTFAAEVDVRGVETPTVRLGAAGVGEMPLALRRAAAQGASVGVFECMAVTPSLISLVQQRMVRAHIVVIPTIRLDHLEEEGLSELDIGMSILQALDRPSIVVTGVTQPRIVEAYRAHAAARAIELRFVAPGAQTPAVPGHHPVNVELALAVAELRGVPRAVAIERLLSVSTEPRALTVQEIVTPSVGALRLLDLGGANDPESAREAFEATGLERDAVIPVLVNRWERPLRALSFIGAVVHRFPAVAIAGTLHRYAIRLDHGLITKVERLYDETRFVRLARSDCRSVETLAAWVDRFSAVASTSGRHSSDGLSPRAERTIVLLENTHDPTADALRRLFDRHGITRAFVPEGGLHA